MGPGDIPTFAAAIALALFMALIGTPGPTLRAVKIDLIIAIRGLSTAANIIR